MADETKDYDVVRVRPEQEIKPKLDELKELIRSDTGMRISNGDAVVVAVMEAISRRKEQQ